VDGQRLVNALVQRRIAPLRLIHEAFSAESPFVTLPGRLVAMGVERTRLLEAFSQLTGLPIAPQARLSAPEPSGLRLELVQKLRDIGAVPLGRDATGQLEVAVISLEALESLSQLELPRYRALVALEQDAIAAIAMVEKGLSARTPPTESLGRDVSIENLSGGVQGKLAHLSLIEIAQLLDSARKDAEVQFHIQDGTDAVVCFQSGHVTWAQFGEHAGNEAFVRLAREREGRFIIFYGRTHDDSNCDGAITWLVLEAARRLDEAAASPAASPAASAGPHSLAAPMPVSVDGVPARGPRPVSFDFSSGATIVPPEMRSPPIPTPPAATPPAATPLRVPKAPRRRQIAGYDIYEELGRGAHGTVYRARRPDSEEDLALKVIVPAGRDRKHFEMRVNRELKVQAELRHRNIVASFDFGPLDGDYYLVAEYAAGGDVGDLLDNVERLPTMVTARIISELLWGIDFAHERGVVHRDLKPGNLLLTGDGELKIADFGLARSVLDPNKSTAGAIIGTPIYMSPEQAMGTGRDHRCDLFAVGTLIYEMVSGENPFQRANDPQSLMAVVHVSRPSLFTAAPWTHPQLADLVDMLHKADPEDRPRSAADAHQHINRLVMTSQRRYPNLMRDLIKDPIATTKKVSADEATLELARARALLGEGSARVPSASLAVMRANDLDPDNAEAKETYAMLQQRFGYYSGGTEVAETQTLESRLEQNPGNLEVLRELVRRFGEEGRLQRLRAALEAMVSVDPNDAAAKTRLTELVGDDRLAPFSTR